MNQPWKSRKGLRRDKWLYGIHLDIYLKPEAYPREAMTEPCRTFGNLREQVG